jgi:hypothetical protein
MIAEKVYPLAVGAKSIGVSVLQPGGQGVFGWGVCQLSVCFVFSVNSAWRPGSQGHMKYADPI